MANRRYDEPRGYRGRSDEEARLRRGPHEDMHPGSRAEWDQNRRDYEDAQEALRTRGREYLASREYRERTGRSGREYAREEGAFYDELYGEHERPRRDEDRTRPSSLLYDTDRWGPGRYGLGTRGGGEIRREVEERLRLEALVRERREPHVYERRYGPVYGHGPGVEDMAPPTIGYSTSPSRPDDHEMGHGGLLGGGLRHQGRGDKPARLRGRGPKGYQRSDARIREDICERLMDAWMDTEHVEVQVKDGEATLVGTVRSRDEKHAIENVAADVLGVKDVQNSLRVLQGGVRDEPDSLRPLQPPEDLLHS